LFEQFDAMLRQAGYIAMSGQIVDASLVAAPRQRNTDDEKKAIKQGQIPANWKANPAKLRHKDRDARWTVKCRACVCRAKGSDEVIHQNYRNRPDQVLDDLGAQFLAGGIGTAHLGATRSVKIVRTDG
jgi:hypothetical protein